jgi:hypothetical protein
MKSMQLYKIEIWYILRKYFRENLKYRIIHMGHVRDSVRFLLTSNRGRPRTIRIYLRVSSRYPSYGEC